MPRELPLGIKFIRSVKASCFPSLDINALLWYRVSVLVLTFVSYSCYHASRKPLSIVKSYFNQSCQNLIPPPGVNLNDSTWCDWAPFYGSDAGTVLGALDSSFLFAYAAAMFLSGYVAERMSLRYFLAAGMISSGIYCYLFGLAHNLKIHWLGYYILVQIFGGIVESSGWPGVVAAMGNWYGKGKRGLIMGLWNSHTSVGNIIGTLIASSLLTYDWGYSFMVPGVLSAGVGLIVFLFLVDHPEDVGLASPNRSQSVQELNEPSLSAEYMDDSPSSDTELLPESERTDKSYTRETEENKDASTESAVGIYEALSIPGVIEFSLCLFFAKMVCYTFLYWLPYYINVSTSYSSAFSADVSTIFDVGGIIGGVFAGAVSDYSGMGATVCCVMLLISLPLMIVYSWFGSSALWLNASLLWAVGFFVNGPYALITTAISADLGCHPSLSSNSKALATVTAIIDGTGSVGAAFGPLLAGLVFSTGWKNVFYMMVAANLLALVMLVRLVKRELRQSLPRSHSGQPIL